MADKQEAPLPVDPGSIVEAQSAILGLLEPEEATPETEDSTPTEDVEESTEETQDEPLEEVSEEEEESDEEEEESEEELDAEEEEEEPDSYTIKVDGEEIEVTLDELKSGYSRQSDYTKKTQEIAEYRKQAEAMMQQAQQEVYQTQQFRQQYIDAASAVVQQQYGKLNDLVNNTDWERLKIEDREEYLTKKSEVADLQSAMQQEEQRLNHANQQAMAEQRQTQQRIAHEERQKLEAILPEWKNEEFRQRAGKELTEFAMSQGFTQEELSQLTDHRSLLVLMQAKAFQEMQKAQTSTKSKKTKKKPKMAKSGTGSKSKSERSKVERTAKMNRLKESGHVNDSVSLFEDFVEL
tara:strand:- start:421 stop:1473 length:1053 start_codon:yes stop_codon:yes gene_type:complete